MGYSPYFSVFLHINWCEPPDFVQPSTGCLLPAFISLVDCRMVPDGPVSRWSCLSRKNRTTRRLKAQANRVDDFSGNGDFCFVLFCFFPFLEINLDPINAFFPFFAGLGRLLSSHAGSGWMKLQSGIAGA